MIQTLTAISSRLSACLMNSIFIELGDVLFLEKMASPTIECRSSSQVAPTLPRPSDILSWTREPMRLNDFLTYSGFDAKRNIAKKEKAKEKATGLKQHKVLSATSAFSELQGLISPVVMFLVASQPDDIGELERFSCAIRPSVQGQYFAVGTDDPEAKHQFLMIMHAETLLKTAKSDPIVDYVSISNHVSDIKWLNSTTILAATGKGDLKLFSFDVSKKHVQNIGVMSKAAGSYIREIAVQPGTSNNVAIGGFDQKLNLLDLNRPDSAYIQRLDLQGVIGSVKWSTLNNGSYVSCCLDEGKYYLFDARTAIKESSFYLNSKKFDLYTHERYNDFMVLLGFGDGTIKHFDMRKANTVLHTEQDPYVDAIGNIEWNQESNAFVVSGYTDFSLWKVRCGECKIWSHSQNGDAVLRGKGWACSASWFDATTVVSAANTGEVGLYIQDFD